MSRDPSPPPAVDPRQSIDPSAHRSVDCTQLDAIEAGRGDQDLANDLAGVAAIYREHATTLALDRVYLADDADQANARSAKIVAHLASAEGGGGEAAAWLDLQNRAWTRLLAVYEQVVRGARFVLAGDPRLDEWFPALVGAARTPAARTGGRGEPTAPTPAPAPPAPPAPPAE